VRFAVEVRSGSADAFHARDLPSPLTRTVWVHEVTSPALVLGSAQRDEVVDRAAVDAAGIEIVRRRSGGGAVLLVPGEVVWVDVLLPAGDPLWNDDVGRASHWLGEVWADVVGGSVHRGALVTTPWSRLVCFDGLGPGEVTVDGRKVVGLSQRRTRVGVRFQCAAYRRFDPSAIGALLNLDDTDRSSLAESLEGGVGVIGDLDIVAEFVARLERV
jgi:lipoate---protein ligase